MNRTPLSIETVFNELTGIEAKEILSLRFADLLSRVPEFANHHITLPRVEMEVEVRLKIHGRNPPTFRISDSCTLRINPQSPTLSGLGDAFSADLHEVIDINADSSTRDGLPPDQLRVEHGLPVHVPTRTPYGIQDVPTVLDGQKYFQPEVVGRTTTVTLDYGPARNRTGGEGINNIPILADRNSHGGSPDVGMQGDFREAIQAGNESRRKGE